MEEVVRKRVVGAVVLVVIGIMLPLLLSRCLHDPAPDGQDMRVYEITPSGSIEPVGDDTEEATTAPAPSETPAVVDGAEEPAVTDSGNEDAQPPVAEDQAAAPEPEPEPEPAPEPEPVPEPQPEPESTPEPEPTAPASDAQETPDTVKSTTENSNAEAAAPADATDMERDVAAGSWIVQVASFGKEQNARALAQQLNDAYSVFYTPAQVNGETWYRVRIGPFDSEAAANNAAAEVRAQGRDTLVMQVD